MCSRRPPRSTSIGPSISTPRPSTVIGWWFGFAAAVLAQLRADPESNRASSPRRSCSSGPSTSTSRSTSGDAEGAARQLRRFAGRRRAPRALPLRRALGPVAPARPARSLLERALRCVAALLGAARARRIPRDRTVVLPRRTRETSRMTDTHLSFTRMDESTSEQWRRHRSRDDGQPARGRRSRARDAALARGRHHGLRRRPAHALPPDRDARRAGRRRPRSRRRLAVPRRRQGDRGAEPPPHGGRDPAPVRARRGLQDDPRPPGLPGPPLLPPLRRRPRGARSTARP